jgi:glucosamine kinase
LAVDKNLLLLGIDGGGTHCRARLSTLAGQILGEAVTGPANLRLGLDASFSSVFEAVGQCLARSNLPEATLEQTVACLALAGASEPRQLAAAQEQQQPFYRTVVTTDAHAACIGAHGERDGGVIVAGTGTVGWAIINRQNYRVGGWGLPLSDEGSGAWLGGEALRRVLWAWDGRIPWSPLLRALFANFDNDPHAIVDWSAAASPRQFGSFTRAVVDHAAHGDAMATELMQLAAVHIDALAARLIAAGAARLALVGGFGPSLKPWLAADTLSHLVEPEGDALDGALRVARSAVAAPARVAR